MHTAKSDCLGPCPFTPLLARTIEAFQSPFKVNILRISQYLTSVAIFQPSKGLRNAPWAALGEEATSSSFSQWKTCFTSANSNCHSLFPFALWRERPTEIIHAQYLPNRFLSQGKNELNTKSNSERSWRDAWKRLFCKCAADLAWGDPNHTFQWVLFSPGAASLFCCPRQRSQLPTEHFTITAKLLCVSSDH